MNIYNHIFWLNIGERKDGKYDGLDNYKGIYDEGDDEVSYKYTV